MAELIPKNSNKILIVIAGPTAIGKTALSIELAKLYNCPIVSYDSRQFYKELTIGTAKPSESELKTAEHHFINSRSISEFYTSGMYETDALETIDSIFKNHDYCIAVGGSGLYINALVYGIDDIPSDLNIRKKLEKRWKEKGLADLQEEVKQIDPEYFQTADIQNPRRMMRALEVYQLSGKTYTSFRLKSKKVRPFKAIWIGLEESMEPLYDRINLRVDQMLKDGLLEEAKGLKQFSDLKALNTVGYVEFFRHFSGDYDLEEAIRLVKRNSRHYAKRQLTWFKKNKDIKWFQPSNKEEIIQYIQANKFN